MADKGISSKAINFKGKLITAVDGSLIGENFKVLQNLRYTDGGIRGVGGMTKINSSALANPKIRNMFHFNKSQPSESHLLVQGWDSGETTSKVYRNSTAIPSAGNFNATALYTDATGAGTGRFSQSSLGDIAYCNSKESCIWGGNEFRVSKFIRYDNSDDTIKYDYTEAISKTDSTSAVLNPTDGIDSNTMLLLHFNNNVTDSSPTTAHTVTINGSTAYDAVNKVFGSHALNFTGGYLTIPDNDDFDLSDGTFTIDGRFRSTDLTNSNIIYYHATDANNYMKFYINSSGAVVISVYADGSAVTSLSTENSVISANTFYHITLIEDEDDWYIYVNGVQKAYTHGNAPANFTGTVYIGYDTTNVFTGQMDEFRISNIVRWTEEFTIPTAEYATASDATYIYLGALRPLQGAKFYVGAANTSASTMSVYYWSGSSWVLVSSLSDGTSSGGVSLAQTGSVTFTSTKHVAEPKVIDETILYWYKIVISAVSGGTSLTYATVDAPFQPIKDLWDGELRSAISFQRYVNSSSSFSDYTSNVLEEDYDSGVSSTYAQLGSMATAGYLAIGFSEPMMGIRFTVVDAASNDTAADATVYYWDGGAWVSVGTLDDGTKEGTKTLNKTGTISWRSIPTSAEFKKEIANELPLYYYKIQFSAILSANVRIDSVSGIAKPKDIGAYKFPVYSGNRLFLCSDTEGDKNSVLVSSKFTSGVFNGSDSAIIYFGDNDELVAGTSLYSQFGSNLYNITVFCKYSQTWILSGDTPDDWTQFQVSDSIGCAAPLTMQSANIEAIDSITSPTKHIAIWQGAEGIYIFDGKSIKSIHDDIADWFDVNNSYSINRSMISRSVGFIDIHNREYHWLFASGESTSLNKELVYDLKRNRWYEIVRGTALQCGCEVSDTNGNRYTFGATSTGYVERLEYGNTFDGTAIAHRVQFGDIILSGLEVETEIRKVKLITVSKTTTSNSISGTHYGDGKTSGTAFTIPTVRSGYRITNTPKGTKLGLNTFHSIDLQISTNNETVGFEPLYLLLLYKEARLDFN